MIIPLKHNNKISMKKSKKKKKKKKKKTQSSFSFTRDGDFRNNFDTFFTSPFWQAFVMAFSLLNIFWFLVSVGKKQKKNVAFDKTKKKQDLYIHSENPAYIQCFLYFLHPISFIHKILHISSVF